MTEFKGMQTYIVGNEFSDEESSMGELLRTLVEAEEDVANGRVALIQETFDDIRKRIRYSIR